MADVEYKTDMGATIRILRGGFPINFDDSGESVPANDIQLTRALVLGSVLQAIQFFGKSEILDKGGVYALDPQIQSFVIREWLKYQPAHRFPKDITDKFQNEEWILEHSGGTYESCEVFSENYTDRLGFASSAQPTGCRITLDHEPRRLLFSQVLPHNPVYFEHTLVDHGGVSELV